LAVAVNTALGPAPLKTAVKQQSADDFELQQYLQLHAINRGILMTPFHNMVLMSPASTLADVAHHDAHFREAVASLMDG
jgi:glutamate-1-semialdehyde 2,1-aminomutase